LLKDLNKYRNKDKDDICQNLELIDDFLAKWYEDEKVMLSKVLKLHGKTVDYSDDIFNQIHNFSNKMDFKWTAEEIKNYLLNFLARDYHKSKNRKIRNIIDNIGGIERIKKLAEMVNDFSTTAYYDDRSWRNGAQGSDKWVISTTDIDRHEQMVKNLRRISEDVRSLTSTMRHDLGCSPAVNRRIKAQLSDT